MYIFKDHAGLTLYVGKAKSLRDRVRSYFQSPINLGPKTAKLVSLIASIEHVEVNSEIEALLLESKLINRLQPPYNIDLKDDKSPYYIHLSKDQFPKPIINHLASGALAGPFLTSLIPKKILSQFRKIAPFCTTSHPSRPCLYSHLGLCSPCPGSPNFDPQLYQKNIDRLRQLLLGKFSQVQKMLKKQMDYYSKRLDYEQALKVKQQIDNLQLLTSQPVLPEEYLVNPNLIQDNRDLALASLTAALNLVGLNITKLTRIELYDIANLSGTSPTAAMTVAIDGKVSPNQYRHFTIKTKSTPDDVHMLQEVLHRRLKHLDWPAPDLIVLDGGKSQLSIISWDIPTIAIAKKTESLLIPSKSGFSQIQLPANHPGLLLLIKLRNEAHRFSRRLHHKHRSAIIH